MKKIIYLLTLSSILFSCKKDKTVENSGKLNESSVARTTDTAHLNDSIVPLDSTKFPKRRQLQQRLAASGDVFSDLYQLNGIDFFIQTRDSYFGKNTFQSQGKGQPIVIAAYSATNNAQLFNMRFLPASTGIPYLIYSSREQAPIGAGSYASSPNTYVLYTQQANSTSLYGFSWDFSKNELNDGYYFQNQDIIGSGSGGPWDIFYYVLNATNGAISFAKLNNSFAQQFNIIPNDQFNVESVVMSLDDAQITESTPTVLRQADVINNTSSVITRTLAFNESRTDASSFTETNGITTRKSGQVSVGVSLFKVVNIGGNYTFEQGTSQTMAYGTSTSTTVSITDSYTITVPPGMVSTYKFKAMHHKVRLPYTARLRGVNTSKIINAGGIYTGVDYSTTSLEVSEYPVGSAGLSSRVAARTYTLYPKKVVK